MGVLDGTDDVGFFVGLKDGSVDPGAGLETFGMLEQLGSDLSLVSSIAELHTLVEEPLQASLERLRGWPGATAVQRQLERGNGVAEREGRRDQLRRRGAVGAAR
ncbi:hypothetical protein DVB87_17900 [Tsukamurella tyrosinosolvens]|nr:hypothetical protein DVB87_17900 [Tsukamurella tyrosinosolvens]